MTMVERPRPARVPKRAPVPLNPEERRRREQAALPTRLTRHLIGEYCGAVRTGLPPAGCAAFVGVDPDTVNRWHATALAVVGRGKPWEERTQYERLCVEFHKQVRRAAGEAMLRVHRAIAEPAGVLGDLPTVTTTTTTKTVDADGAQVGEATVVSSERTLAPDWRAALAIARYRFPGDMGPLVDDETDGQQGVGERSDISPQAIWDRFRQRLAEVRSGEEPIDAEVVED